MSRQNFGERDAPPDGDFEADDLLGSITGHALIEVSDVSGLRPLVRARDEEESPSLGESSSSSGTKRAKGTSEAADPLKIRDNVQLMRDLLQDEEELSLKDMLEAMRSKTPHPSLPPRAAPTLPGRKMLKYGMYVAVMAKPETPLAQPADDECPFTTQLNLRRNFRAYGFDQDLCCPSPECQFMMACSYKKHPLVFPPARPPNVPEEGWHRGLTNPRGVSLRLEREWPEVQDKGGKRPDKPRLCYHCDLWAVTFHSMSGDTRTVPNSPFLNTYQVRVNVIGEFMARNLQLPNGHVRGRIPVFNFEHLVCAYVMPGDRVTRPITSKTDIQKVLKGGGLADFIDASWQSFLRWGDVKGVPCDDRLGLGPFRHFLIPEAGSELEWASSEEGAAPFVQPGTPRTIPGNHRVLPAYPYLPLTSGRLLHQQEWSCDPFSDTIDDDLVLGELHTLLLGPFDPLVEGLRQLRDVPRWLLAYTGSSHVMELVNRITACCIMCPLLTVIPWEPMDPAAYRKTFESGHPGIIGHTSSLYPHHPSGSTSHYWYYALVMTINYILHLRSSPLVKAMPYWPEERLVSHHRRHEKLLELYRSFYGTHRRLATDLEITALMSASPQEHHPDRIHTIVTLNPAENLGGQLLELGTSPLVSKALDFLRHEHPAHSHLPGGPEHWSDTLLPLATYLSEPEQDTTQQQYETDGVWPAERLEALSLSGLQHLHTSLNLDEVGLADLSSCSLAAAIGVRCLEGRRLHDAILPLVKKMAKAVPSYLVEDLFKKERAAKSATLEDALVYYQAGQKLPRQVTPVSICHLPQGEEIAVLLGYHPATGVLGERALTLQRKALNQETGKTFILSSGEKRAMRLREIIQELKTTYLGCGPSAAHEEEESDLPPLRYMDPNDGRNDMLLLGLEALVDLKIFVASHTKLLCLARDIIHTFGLEKKLTDKILTDHTLVFRSKAVIRLACRKGPECDQECVCDLDPHLAPKEDGTHPAPSLMELAPCLPELVPSERTLPSLDPEFTRLLDANAPIIKKADLPLGSPLRVVVTILEALGEGRRVDFSAWDFWAAHFNWFLDLHEALVFGRFTYMPRSMASLLELCDYVNFKEVRQAPPRVKCHRKDDDSERVRLQEREEDLLRSAASPPGSKHHEHTWSLRVANPREELLPEADGYGAFMREWARRRQGLMELALLMCVGRTLDSSPWLKPLLQEKLVAPLSFINIARGSALDVTLGPWDDPAVLASLGTDKLYATLTQARKITGGQGFTKGTLESVGGLQSACVTVCLNAVRFLGRYGQQPSDFARVVSSEILDAMGNPLNAGPRYASQQLFGMPTFQSNHVVRDLGHHILTELPEDHHHDVADDTDENPLAKLYSWETTLAPPCTPDTPLPLSSKELLELKEAAGLLLTPGDIDPAIWPLATLHRQAHEEIMGVRPGTAPETYALQFVRLLWLMGHPKQGLRGILRASMASTALPSLHILAQYAGHGPQRMTETLAELSEAAEAGRVCTTVIVTDPLSQTIRTLAGLARGTKSMSWDIGLGSAFAVPRVASIKTGDTDQQGQANADQVVRMIDNAEAKPQDKMGHILAVLQQRHLASMVHDLAQDVGDVEVEQEQDDQDDDSGEAPATDQDLPAWQALDDPSSPADPATPASKRKKRDKRSEYLRRVVTLSSRRCVARFYRLHPKTHQVHLTQRHNWPYSPFFYRWTNLVTLRGGAGTAEDPIIVDGPQPTTKNTTLGHTNPTAASAPVDLSPPVIIATCSYCCGIFRADRSAYGDWPDLRCIDCRHPAPVEETVPCVVDSKLLTLSNVPFIFSEITGTASAIRERPLPAYQHLKVSLLDAHNVALSASSGKTTAAAAAALKTEDIKPGPKQLRSRLAKLTTKHPIPSTPHIPLELTASQLGFVSIPKPHLQERVDIRLRLEPSIIRYLQTRSRRPEVAVFAAMLPCKDEPSKRCVAVCHHCMNSKQQIRYSCLFAHRITYTQFHWAQSTFTAGNTFN